jgi:acetamidase/formamidase
MIKKFFWLTLAALIPAHVGAETHQFVPTRFFNTFSGAHPPVLKIRSGDRVVTKTIDAAGVDWEGRTVGVGPNPQTGPFYVEGAEPGDLLVVTIERLETNRATAYSASLLAPYAVTPQAIATRTERDARRVTWQNDKAHTSELHHWLMADYGLSERGASLLMGQALEYEIANVVDPSFTVVAKMQKSLLKK